ncbi:MULTISPECIES: hypothetical protein [Sporosarcina]|uniref:Uncharacterized protein n=1 Tax=Sporosarcina contaminans TaxID=633403 RepID=A0ABW3TWQ6_9BACL
MFKDMVDVYNRNLIGILLLMLFIIFPITSFIFIAIIQFSIEFEGNLSVFFLGYSLLFNFIICLPPFLWLTLRDFEDERAGLKECLTFFATQFGPLLFTSFLFYTLAIYTSWMMMVPTIVLLLFTIIYPFFSDYPSIKEMFVQAKNKIIEENIAIVVDMIIVVSVLLFLWAGMMFFIQNFNNNMLSYMLVRSLINMIIFPILYIYLTIRYRQKKEDFSMINI